MKLVVLARQTYDKYSKQGLFEAAEQDGVVCLHVALLSRDNKIEITRKGNVLHSVPYSTSARQVANLIRQITGTDKKTVLWHTSAYAEFFKTMGIKLFLKPDIFIFSVTDWYFYEARGIKLAVFRLLDEVYKRCSDGITVLMEDMQSLYPGAYHLDNASHLAQAPQVAPGDRKVAVISSFDRRTDYELLRHVAQRLPQYEFHLYGWIHFADPQVAQTMKELQSVPNIHYYGEYRNATLGPILSQYRIGLMPYHADHKLTRYINPDKIYHYLCSGLEVVAIPVPQAMKVQQYLHLANDEAGIVAAIENITAGKELKNPGDLFRNFNWGQRWLTMKEIIRRVSGRSE